MDKFSGLGKKQKYVLGKLATGWHITVQTNFSTGEHFIDLADEEDENIEYINSSIFFSLCRRGLLYYVVVYTSIQPDTETAHYKLKKEFVDYVVARY